jgi:hypothetical protein
MLRRLVLPALALLFATTRLYAADDLPPKTEAVPGTCFVYSAEKEAGIEPDPAAAIVSRIDLQPLQFKAEGKPLPQTRMRIGILPKGEKGPMANDISAPCTGEGLSFTCTMKCGDKIVGKFRAEALKTKPETKADHLKLVIEGPTLLDGCTEGKQPFNVPPALINVDVILKGAEASACFK